jgi:hypothetical protein
MTQQPWNSPMPNSRDPKSKRTHSALRLAALQTVAVRAKVNITSYLIMQFYEVSFKRPKLRIDNNPATEGSEIAMPSWPMIEYQAETWCLLVTHSSSHVRLALLRIPSPTFWALQLIIKSIDQCNRINCVHSHNSIIVESSCQHSAVS